MPMPEMDEKSRERPLSYDPSRRKFIRFDEIVSGKERIIPWTTYRRIISRSLSSSAGGSYPGYNRAGDHRATFLA